MSRVRKIARRGFLIGSAAIVGGVAFGVYQIRKDPENPLLEGRAEGEAVFNPWVKIDASGVTLITPHVDFGQGGMSVQAALIAEELDLEFGQFHISHGVPSPAYYNTALADDAVPFMSTDTGFVAETMRGAMGAAMKIMGMQVTGGSSLIPDSFDKLRKAGAVARATLIKAAAQHSGIDESELKTRDGAVHFPDGQTMSYTDLAPIAATLEPVQDVPLRDPSQWRFIGKPLQRMDILAKSTGTQPYGIDVDLPDMVFAAVRMNPQKSGDPLDFDPSPALAMRGALKVVRVTGGVAVIADNTWRAFQAASALDLSWPSAPYPQEQAAHWDEVAASFTPERLDKTWRDDGDVDDIHRGSDAITAEYRAPYVAHQPLEPLSATVQIHGDRADIWVGHQMPRFMQERVAQTLGLSAGQVTVHTQAIGGSFGHRLEFLNTDLAAQIALHTDGRPVKLTFQREEDFVQDFPRQIGMARGTGTVKNGQVQSLDLGIATVSSSRSQMGRLGQSIPGPDAQIVAGAWNQPYDISHMRVNGYAVPELLPTSSWRSVGASSAGFFAESFLDELIHQAGADPMMERLRMVNDPAARNVLETAATMSDWGTPLGANQGRGVAFVTSFGVPVAEVIEVTNTPQGIRIDKVFVAADVGRIVDPVNFENNVMGGVIWGLGHAMNCEITVSGGMPEQNNYYAHEGMRFAQCPKIFVTGLENADKIRGIGEPPVPPAAPALANAIFAATGTRLREMPFNKFVDFV